MSTANKHIPFIVLHSYTTATHVKNCVIIDLAIFRRFSMKKVVFFAFKENPMCFVHVMLNALDMKEKGYDVRIVLEGEAVNLIQELGRKPSLQKDYTAYRLCVPCMLCKDESSRLQSKQPNTRLRRNGRTSFNDKIYRTGLQNNHNIDKQKKNCVYCSSLFH